MLEPKVAILQGKMVVVRGHSGEAPRSTQVSENQLLEIFDPCTIPAGPFTFAQNDPSGAWSRGCRSWLRSETWRLCAITEIGFSEDVVEQLAQLVVHRRR